MISPFTRKITEALDAEEDAVDQEARAVDQDEAAATDESEDELDNSRESADDIEIEDIIAELDQEDVLSLAEAKVGRMAVSKVRGRCASLLCVLLKL